MRVSVESNRCVASGNCVMVASEVFDQDEDNGVVIVVDDAPGPQSQAAVRDAAMLCPAAAIQLAGPSTPPPAGGRGIRPNR